MQPLAAPETGELSPERFRARLSAAPVPRMTAGRTVQALCTIENRSTVTWSSTPPNPVQLGLRWHDAHTRRLVRLRQRIELPRPLAPGEMVEVPMAISPPAVAGDYLLTVGLVQEGVAWFEAADVEATAVAAVRVAAEPGAEPALPPPELADRVAGTDDLAWFHLSGKKSVADIDRALGTIGLSLAMQQRVLDFGCGCGRIIRWLAGDAEATDLHGVDIDAEAIAWAEANVAGATFHRTGPLPPLPFETGYFDLIYNHSVFTHLPEDYQDAWLDELARILRVGGTAVLSVSGEFSFHDQLGQTAAHDPELQRLWDEKGFVYWTDDAWTGGPFPDFYHTTFHAPWYVFRRWGEVFDVRALLPRGSLGRQDFVVLSKRDAG